MEATICVNGKEVGLNPQMQKVLCNILAGYVKSLDGVESSVLEISAVAKP